MSALFETERLIVRRFESKDAADIAEFASDPSVADEIPEVDPRDPVRLQEYIDRQREVELFPAKTCVDLAIERRDDGKVLGLLTFISDGAGQGEIGWALGVAHRGRGYVTEAARGLIGYVFEVRGYHRVFCGTTATNERSRNLMERLGMRKEAHFREAHVPESPGGPWVDTVRYAVLASEWPDHPVH
jgi:RimJ/RimL family protein N-acetyltransferase